MPLHGFVMPKHQLFFRFEEKVLQNCDGYQPSLILIDTILMAVVVPQLSCVWSFLFGCVFLLASWCTVPAILLLSKSCAG